MGYSATLCEVSVQLVWSTFMSSCILCLNCFHSVLRNFEDTTEESFASKNLIPLDVKKEIPIQPFVLRHTSVSAFGLLHNIVAPNIEVFLVMALKIPISEKMLHLRIFQDTSEASTLAKL